MPTTWIILTGEYPPRPGGVSDYTRQLAAALAERGDLVHVVAPGPLADDSPGSGIHLHPLDGCFDQAACRAAGAIIKSLPSPKRLLVQYVPHIYGRRAMNVGFVRWIDQLARQGEAVDVMYHEVAYPLEPGQKLKHRLLAWVTRYMAKVVGRRADRIFVSTEIGESVLRGLGVRRPARWLPIFSNVSTTADLSQVERIREKVGGVWMVGHFGTYGDTIAKLLVPLFEAIAHADADAKFLFAGRRSVEFRELLDHRSILYTRSTAVGELPAEQLSNHLAACDVMVQPFIEGVTTRRGSIMASIALGVPVVTCRGPISETIWESSGAVALATDPSPTAMLATYQAATESPEKLLALGAAGRKLYNERFDITRTLDALQEGVEVAETAD